MKNYLKSMLIILGSLGVFTVAILLLLISNTISISTIGKVIAYISMNKVLNVVTMVALTILGVCAIISVAFSGKITSDILGGIVLPLKVGDVHISSQTFESIVTNIAKKYSGIKTGKVNIKMKETGISVDLFVYVLQDTVISDITSKIQLDIKETVFKQTTVAVENVNVKIKGIYTLNENKEA